MLQFSEPSAFELDNSLCVENEETDSLIINAGSVYFDIMNYPVDISQKLLERIIITGPIQVVIAYKENAKWRKCKP